MTQQIIDIHSAITALSCSLDLVGVDEVKHGKRVAVMSWAVAQQLGWTDQECLSMLYAGMLHDCGVSKIQEHRQISDTLEWEGAEGHCIRGHQYLSACPLLAHLALQIRYHHTRWEDLLNLPLSDDLRLRANLLFLTDRVDVLQAPFLGSDRILIEYPEILKRIQSLAGSLFAPALVDALLSIASVEAFWLAMEPEYLDEDLQRIGRNIAPISVDSANMRELARLFSRVVDAKSPFTDEHSQRVALIARQLATDLGVDESKLDQIEIAGLLHDIGKLRVSEAIIDKPGSLTAKERAAMNRHSYDTFRILNRVFADTQIPVWAGFHHESLLGDGYPFHTPNQAIDLECRIITVADIFQALAQIRPYRGRVGLDDILIDLQRRVDRGSLDGEVVSKLGEHASYYYQLATE